MLGIHNFEKGNNFFTKDDIRIESDFVKNEWTKIINELENYYLSCKFKKYCNAITQKKIITIVRQCLKVYNMGLKSQEKYVKGSKYLQYVVTVLENQSNVIEKKCTVVFD